MMKSSTAIGMALLVLGVSGCVSGGGTNDFVSFATIPTGETTRIPGNALVASYNVDNNGKVSPDTTPTTYSTAANVHVTSSGNVDSGSVSIPSPDQGASISYSTSNYSTAPATVGGITGDPTDNFLGVAADAGNAVIAVPDPTMVSFNYQSFGIWANGDLSPSSSGYVSAFSGGAPTADVASLSGTASYDGVAAGWYVDDQGVPYAAFADFHAGINFDANKVTSLYTSDTYLTNPNLASPMEASNLDFNQTNVILPDVSATGAFTSEIGADGLNTGTMTGQLNGQVFGPNGEEVGGLFQLSGSGGSYMGAVGGTQ